MASKTIQLCKYFCILQILFVHGLSGWETFYRGRRFGGDLGLLGDDNQNYNLSISDEWFTQKLDHSNPSDSRTWRQRYHTNTQYHKSGGPVFIMIGGEWKIDSRMMSGGPWINYARQYGALLFQLEHRYYGPSRPTSDLSTHNLKYLSSGQALADLADFIVAMNAKHRLPQGVKWIAIGGSYAGSLAAWLRLKYPNLVHGAQSSSGPLLAKVDFQEYFKVVGEALRTHSGACMDSVKQAYSQMNGALSSSAGQQNINKKFRLCKPIDVNSRHDVVMLNRYLAYQFAAAVQYNTNSRNQNGKISELCNIMTNNQLGTPLDRLAAVNSKQLESSQHQCMNIDYNGLINYMKQTTWGEGMMRQWAYQTCTEFGFYQTSSQPSAVFGNKIPASVFVQECQDIFGPKFNSQFVHSAVDKTNSVYRGLNIDATNVVYVHGSIDPWYPLGITQSTNQNAPAIFIRGSSHCADLAAERADDLSDLKAARTKIGQYIGSWLKS